jgi:hypothetical protein
MGVPLGRENRKCIPRRKNNNKKGEEISERCENQSNKLGDSDQSEICCTPLWVPSLGAGAFLFAKDDATENNARLASLNQPKVEFHVFVATDTKLLRCEKAQPSTDQEKNRSSPLAFSSHKNALAGVGTLPRLENAVSLKFFLKAGTNAFIIDLTAAQNRHAFHFLSTRLVALSESQCSCVAGRFLFILA